MIQIAGHCYVVVAQPAAKAAARVFRPFRRAARHIGHRAHRAAHHVPHAIVPHVQQMVEIACTRNLAAARAAMGALPLALGTGPILAPPPTFLQPFFGTPSFGDFAGEGFPGFPGLDFGPGSLGTNPYAVSPILVASVPTGPNVGGPLSQPGPTVPVTPTPLPEVVPVGPGPMQPVVPVGPGVPVVDIPPAPPIVVPPVVVPPDIPVVVPPATPVPAPGPLGTAAIIASCLALLLCVRHRMPRGQNPVAT